MIHVFHGFLGSPSDLSFLGQQVKLHDLYAEMLDPQITPEDTLIGYSMGGRKALELASSSGFKKLVLINAHPGLATAEEKNQRAKWEDSVLDKLRTSSKEEFLTYWNSLEIFRSDAPLVDVSDEIFANSAELFERYRLSKQKYFLPLLEQYREKILWVIGSADEKYRTLAQTVLLPAGFRCAFVTGGHRLFQNQGELLGVLHHENVL
ncbi:MAG TPA: hypothetical protein VNJ01_02245 [Bacteriovoracaceae bacterium]|nr:hypothetical protein [Bacteriovoracaceae bacterium]